MKKIFNNETCPLRSTAGIPAIVISVNSLVFNADAISLIGLEKGDRVSFEQDEGDKFFLRIDPEKGIPVRSTNKNSMVIGRTSLRQALHRAVGHPRFRFEVGDQKYGRYPLTVVTYNKK